MDVPYTMLRTYLAATFIINDRASSFWFVVGYAKWVTTFKIATKAMKTECTNKDVYNL